MRPKIALVHHFTREVDDVTAANRDLIERALFLALSRDRCPVHARYSVDRFVLTTTRSKAKTTIAHVTRCCPPDDDHLRMLIDLAPSIAMQNREEILKLTRATRKGSFDLEANPVVGFWRRRRGETLTLEATLTMSGAERMTDAQVGRLRALIDEAAAKGRLACPVHGKSAVEAVHVTQEKKATVVDSVVCCGETHAAIMVVQQRVDDALLSGPVVAISAGAFAKKKR